MLLILLNWIFIFCTTYTLGYAGLSLLKIYNTHKEDVSLHPALISLSGLAIITTLGNYFSLLFPIDIYFVWTLVLLTITALFIFRNNLSTPFRTINVKNIHPLLIIFGAGFFFIAMVKSSGPTEVWDEGQYFLPLIRWIEQYPAVPGSALFHDRMGYNSAFHMSSAIYGWSFWFKGGMYDLNGYLFLLINFYFLGGVKRIIRKEYETKLSDYLMLFSGIALYRQLLTSMDADYPHVFIGLTLLVIFLEKSSQKNLKVWDTKANAFLLLSIYLVTVKFLAVFFSLFIAVLLFYQIRQKQWKLIGLCLMVAFIGFLPWLTRNVIMTGYLVYPLYQFDFFTVDWKIPMEIAKNNYLYVGEHAKTLVERHSLYYDGASNISVSEWLPKWWTNHATINISALITAIILPPGLLVLTVYLIRFWKKLRSEKTEQLLTIFIVLLFLIFWFFQYPNVRFGWAWILVVIVFTMVKTHKVFFRISPSLLRILAIALFSLSLLRGIWKTVNESEHLLTQMVIPVETKVPEAVLEKTIGEYKAVFTPDMHCWGAPPPCGPIYYQGLEVVPRGEKFTEGFKIE